MDVSCYKTTNNYITHIYLVSQNSYIQYKSINQTNYQSIMQITKQHFLQDKGLYLTRGVRIASYIQYTIHFTNEHGGQIRDAQNNLNFSEW